VSVRYALACRDSAKVVSQANQRQAKEALAKIPQTAVCGYFKSSLLGQANPMANVVPEPTLFREGWTEQIHKLPFAKFNSFPRDC